MNVPQQNILSWVTLCRYWGAGQTYPLALKLFIIHVHTQHMYFFYVLNCKITDSYFSKDIQTELYRGAIAGLFAPHRHLTTTRK